jgi:hypothetical protein
MVLHNQKEADMSKLSVSAATTFVMSLLLVAATQAQTTEASPETDGMSKVRIVRLSQVRGMVHVDRSTGRGFEAAMANLPIVEQNRLRTDDGVAEVEFEDNSTLRLGPDSMVEFPQLERLQSGPTVSAVHLVKGTAYVSLVKTPGNQFTLIFGDQKLALQPATHIRLQLTAEEAKLGVLDGDLRIDSETGPLDITKKKTVTFNRQSQVPPTVAKDIVSDPLDSWDKDATGYHARTAAMSAFGNSPYSYGVNDMAYYGNFADAGCGSMWRPYFASAGWDPYSNGALAWYPGGGYSWVSPYPWAWTPYHYGSWTNCPGVGWGWQPGGNWNGLNNTTALLLHNRPRLLPIPKAPPAAGEPTLKAVNLKPIVRSEIASSESFVFRKDSAGLGVPRTGIGKLSKLSQQAESRGASTAPVYINVPVAANGRMTSASISASSIHRGYAPSNEGGSSSARSSSASSAERSAAGPVMSSAPSVSSGAHASSGSGSAHH